MKLVAYLQVWLMTMRARVGDELRRNDRGDVPGWVMVTVMSAVLVVAILGVFEPQIKKSLSGILDSVSGAGK